MGGRWWDRFGSRGVAGRGGLVATAVILTAAAELPGHEADFLVLVEAHLEGGGVHHQPREPPSPPHSLVNG